MWRPHVGDERFGEVAVRPGACRLQHDTERRELCEGADKQRGTSKLSEAMDPFNSISIVGTAVPTHTDVQTPAAALNVQFSCLGYTSVKPDHKGNAVNSLKA